MLLLGFTTVLVLNFYSTYKINLRITVLFSKIKQFPFEMSPTTLWTEYLLITPLIETFTLAFKEASALVLFTLKKRKYGNIQ